MRSRPMTSEGGMWGSYIPYVEALEQENDLLRQPMATFTESGELEDIHAWTPVEAGRLDELESAAAKLDKIAKILDGAGSYRMADKVREILDE